MPFRLLLLSFLDLLERAKSFLLTLSRSLSFPIFLVRFTDGRPDEMEADPDVTVSEERHLPLVLLEEEDSDWPIFFDVRDFFFG